MSIKSTVMSAMIIGLFTGSVMAAGEEGKVENMKTDTSTSSSSDKAMVGDQHSMHGKTEHGGHNEGTKNLNTTEKMKPMDDKTHDMHGKSEHGGHNMDH